MSKYLFVLLSAVALLGGCTLTPEYTRPDAPISATWPKGSAYKETQTPFATAAEIHWRDFFSDQRLQKVIEMALENNRDLRLAALNVQRARAMYRVQRAELFPAIDASADISKQRVPADLSSTGYRYTAEQYNVDLGIFSWEIDFFGRLRSLKDQALQEFLATEQARRSTQIMIINSVAEAYLTLTADWENLRLADTTFENQKSYFDLIKRRHEIGLATKLALNQAQTQVDVARRDIGRYTQLVAQDKNALDLLLGTSSTIPDEIIPVKLTDIAPMKEISAGISSEVLLYRPDILRAENLLKAANANIGVARAALFPKISLTTTVGTASSELSGLFDDGQGTWSFAPGITMPIFDDRRWSNLDISKAEREIALVEYEQAIQTAFREVADALAVQGTVDHQLSAQISLVKATAETYRLSDLRYTNGIDDYLSVLDAQRSLYASQQDLVILRLTKLANQVRLYAVLGGGGDSE